MGLSITANQLAQVQALHSQGKVGEAWQLLSSFGDNYATAAFDVVAQPLSFYGQTVRNTWSAVGADFSKFGDVAADHQKQYLALITSEDGYALPNTTQIEISYFEALRRNEVTPYAAIDFNITLNTPSALDWYTCPPFWKSRRAVPGSRAMGPDRSGSRGARSDSGFGRAMAVCGYNYRDHLPIPSDGGSNTDTKREGRN
jgi:hypothetical protein